MANAWSGTVDATVASLNGSGTLSGGFTYEYDFAPRQSLVFGRAIQTKVVCVVDTGY